MGLKVCCVIAGCALSLNAIAGAMGTASAEDSHPWSVIGSLGYSWFDAAYDGGASADALAQNAIGDGQTALGRFAIGYNFGDYKTVRFGAEIGVQSSNTFRSNIPQFDLDSEVDLESLGGMPVQLNMKPMLDLLATASYQPVESVPVDAIVKLGIAYRRLQINDRVTFNDLSQVAFEVQAGLGMQVSERANLSLSYQGVFDGTTTYLEDPVLGIGHVTNIPALNGLLLSLTYRV